ncbi:MAG TPA: hypothetical protein DEQ30_09600 [Porphyromonadaceae bacterium]|nr:hypothetical protein [Porphyromonadaceae bacterium]
MGKNKSNKNLVKDLISPDVLLQLAKRQNKRQLYDKFKNIEYINDTYNGSKKLSIYVKDDDIQDIPKSVTVRLNEETKLRVKTEIVPQTSHLLYKSSFGYVSPIGQNSYGIGLCEKAPDVGSICCLVQHRKFRFLGLLTAGHIFTGNTIKNFCGENYSHPKVYSRGNLIGSLFSQYMSPSSGDIAFVQLNKIHGDLPLKRFYNNIYDVSTMDEGKLQVKISSKKSRLRDALVYKAGINIGMHYGGVKMPLYDVIELRTRTGSTSNVPISMGGDSGGCVYIEGNKGNDALVGMLIGGDYRSCYVLPISKILNIFNVDLP